MRASVLRAESRFSFRIRSTGTKTLAEPHYRVKIVVVANVQNLECSLVLKSGEKCRKVATSQSFPQTKRLLVAEAILSISSCIKIEARDPETPSRAPRSFFMVRLSMDDPQDIRARIARLRAEVTEFLNSLSRLRAEGTISGLDLLRFERKLKEMLPDDRKLSPGPVEWERGKRNFSYGQFESKRSRH